MKITSLLGMFLAKTVSRITDVYGPNVNLSFAMPPDCNSSVPRAIREGNRMKYGIYHHLFPAWFHLFS